MAVSKDVPPSVWQQRRMRIAREKAARAAQKRRPSPRAKDTDEGDDGAEKAAPRRGQKGAGKPQIGFLRASTIERAFILLIYGGVLTLVALSIVGTFYGGQRLSAPITDPRAIWKTMTESGNKLYLAIGVQVALSLTQYGARQLARYDWRWWLLYLAALGISVYFNVQAYYTPLMVYMLPGYVILLILAFDILPEFVSIRHD